ncbi:MAG: 50S ribosomal protein L22 [Anaerolineae bacterium]|nr:50S ribosomal protein L22 [Anaerolineae bacterium]MCA9909685.1 50S ribosomal protein L22 [Anaerolineae bacterium]
MDVRAYAKGIFISPQKLGLVCDKVRGMQAEQALVVLEFMPHKGAHFIQKLLKSALANAENNFDLERDEMYISSIFAGDGPTLKRYKAGARGRYKPRQRRSSHLTLVLSQREAN